MCVLGAVVAVSCAGSGGADSLPEGARPDSDIVADSAGTASSTPSSSSTLLAHAFRALIVPVDAFAVPDPLVVQNAEAALAPNRASSGPRTRMSRRRFISEHSQIR